MGIAGQTQSPKLMSFDMGGTSTDVALLNGRIPLTSHSRIGSWPLSIPTVDIHTIGAGGGSIARVDAAGMLLVGPESAGANPGPACYGQGGALATVTDANLLLGRIPEDTLLGGYLPLDIAAARLAVAELADRMGCSLMQAAAGIVRLANEHMARALRVISVERGHDPAEYALLCFGGAGGLHACELAELLNMKRIVIPARSGVFSAVGMLVSEPGRESSCAVLKPLARMADADIKSEFHALENEAVRQLAQEGCDPTELRFRHQLELRYQGQSATIAIPFVEHAPHEEAFHTAHEKASGLRLPHPVELVNIRLSTRGRAILESIDIEHKAGRSGATSGQHSPELGIPVPVWPRADLQVNKPLTGPCIVTEEVATSWVKPGWAARMDLWGNLEIYPAEAIGDAGLK
jgi:N-methylhydantoinase A